LVKGKDGKPGFWGCSGYKKEGDGCKQTYPDLKGKPDYTPKNPPSGFFNCMQCGRPLRMVQGREGKSGFWGCTGFKSGDCKKTYPDLKGKPNFTAT
jgi:ssDNA-binding Zn-finger/Zn-ribbon topoisomerase 1